MEDNSVNKMTFTVLNAQDIEMYETGSSDQKKLAVLKENVRLWDSKKFSGGLWTSMGHGIGTECHII